MSTVFSLSSFPFLSFSLCSFRSLLFPAAKWSYIPLRVWGAPATFPGGGGENDVCRHQTCFLGSKYAKNAFAANTLIFLVYLEPTGNVSGGCKTFVK